MRQIKSLIGRIADLASIKFFQLLPGSVGDGRLRRTSRVHHGGKTLFRTIDLGPITRMRASTFSEKEPETILWIDSFVPNSAFLDVGSNVGMYAIYAATRECEVIAVEPDALNFAVLNQNIRLNSVCTRERVRAYPIALHRDFAISDLNLTAGEWGAAMSSFGNTTDFKGDEFMPRFHQGAIGLSMDDFLARVNFQPSHVKIDVDGNEGEVLAGASRTLRSETLISIMIELDDRRGDYATCIGHLESAGFSLREKFQNETFSTGVFGRNFNHLFCRKHG